MTTAMNHDRTFFEEHPEMERRLDELREYLKKTGQLGRIKVD